MTYTIEMLHGDEEFRASRNGPFSVYKKATFQLRLIERPVSVCQNFVWHWS